MTRLTYIYSHIRAAPLELFARQADAESDLMRRCIEDNLVPIGRVENYTIGNSGCQGFRLAVAMRERDDVRTEVK